MNPWILLGIALVALAIIIALQRHLYFLQYVYFCRAPLLVGALLILIPFLAMFRKLSLLPNFYALEAVDLAVVMFFASLAAFSVMFSLAMMLRNLRAWTKLPFVRDTGRIELLEEASLPTRLAKLRRVWARFCVRLARGLIGWKLWAQGSKPKRLWLRTLVFLAILALPHGVAAIVLGWSRATDEDAWLARGELALAVLAGMAVAELTRRFVLRGIRPLLGGIFGALAALPPFRWVGRSVGRVLAKGGDFVERRFDGFDFAELRFGDDVEQEWRTLSASGFERAVAYLVLVLVVYWLGLTYFHPLDPPLDAPALVFVLLLTILLNLTFSGLSWIFDRLRVPIVAVSVLVIILLYNVSGTDHFYSLRGSEHPTPAPTVGEAFAAWQDSLGRARARVPIFVAASGGGITAGFWTASVLQELATDLEFGEAFRDAVFLMSSVSGGGLGTLYFIDALGSAQSDALAGIAHRAGSPSLSAAAWGFAYPDFLRVVLPFAYARSDRDRGWAIEQPWRRQMLDRRATLRAWGEDAAVAKRPVQIFNCTIAESGDRFLMSTVRLTPTMVDGRPATTSFFEEYGDAFDVDVATAARLSATFPFVSPIARPLHEKVPESVAWHLADGGYYDNYGVVTALEQIEQVIRHAVEQQRPLQRLILLQIRMEPSPRPAADLNSGFKYSTYGPIQTLLKVRGATQIARNEYELRLAGERWSESGVVVVPLVAQLDGKWPLSWQLSSLEKEQIRSQLSSPRMDALRAALRTELAAPATGVAIPTKLRTKR